MIYLDVARRSPGVRRLAGIAIRMSALTIVPLMLAIFAGSASGSAEPRSVSASPAPSTGWKSKPIHWTDTQTLNEGGRLIYRATNIRLGGDRFVIAASVTNSSPNRVAINALSGNDAPGTTRPPTFGLVYREAPNPNISTRRLIPVRATSFAPELPQFLDPGQTWKGTFSGSSKRLHEHHDWWIAYGLFAPGGYWVSDKSFST